MLLWPSFSYDVLMIGCHNSWKFIKSLKKGSETNDLFFSGFDLCRLHLGDWNEEICYYYYYVVLLVVVLPQPPHSNHQTLSHNIHPPSHTPTHTHTHTPHTHTHTPPHTYTHPKGCWPKKLPVFSKPVSKFSLFSVFRIPVTSISS